MAYNWILAFTQLEVEKSLQNWQFNARLSSSTRALGLEMQQCFHLERMIHHMCGESWQAGLPCVGHILLFNMVKTQWFWLIKTEQHLAASLLHVFSLF